MLIHRTVTILPRLPISISRQKARLRLCLWLCLWCLLVIGLMPLTLRAQYRFDHWTTDKGLPQNSVLSIQQTGDGYLWFTTLEGLVRFDGVKFTVFNKTTSKNLSTSRFTNLLAEADGTFWLGTEENGLIRFQNGEFQNFTVADGLPSERIHAIQKDVDGSLLITVDKGSVRFGRDKHFSLERSGDFREYKIYLAPSGARWELEAAGLRKIQAGQTTRYDLPFDVNHISSDPTNNYPAFVQLFEDRQGALWLTAANTLFKLQNGIVTTFSAANRLPASRIENIAEDAAGNLWVGTEKDGACRLSDARFVCFTTKNGLSSDAVTKMFLDREGTFWIGTKNGGINRVTRQVVSPLSTAAGLFDKNVYPILEDRRGVFWIGSFSALAKYENGTIKNYRRGDGLLYEIVQSLFEDRDGRLWIGSVGGLEYFENGKFYDFTAKLKATVGADNFWDIHQDRNGAFWFATNEGVLRYDGAAVTRFTDEDGLPDKEVKAILEARDGTLWFATNKGVAAFKNGKFAALTDKGGLTVDQSRIIYEDDKGILWIGSYDGGLWRFAGGKLTHYTVESGLFSNGVFQILEDGRGNFWMSSNQGIYRVAKQQLDDFADGKIAKVTSTVFGKSDGMLNTECNGGRQPAGIKAKDGKLWFPTQDGAAIIDPESVPFNPAPPPVVIESVLIDKQPAARGQTAVTIQPNQNNLEIAYTGLSFIKSEQIRFRYRLTGLDENWTEAGARRTAYFPYLPPGNYRFQVIAANSDNVWNEQGASLAIIVLPTFYQTWWFLLVSILSVAAITFLLYRLRIGAIKRQHAAETAFSRRLIDSQEQERKRFAAEMHDGLGQSFVIIKNRARLSLKQPENQTAMLEHLENISETASHALEETREIAFNLRPHLLDRLGLTETVKSMIEKVSSASGIEFETHIVAIDDLLGKDSEILLYRIVQESVNNIVKHSQATKAFVSIKPQAQNLIINISDNGRGFDASPEEMNALKSGFGLVGISERTRLLNGRMKIESAIGNGATIIIEIELTKQNES